MVDKLSLTHDQKLCLEARRMHAREPNESEFKKSRHCGLIDKRALSGTKCGECQLDISGKMARYDVGRRKMLCLKCGSKRI